MKDVMNSIKLKVAHWVTSDVSMQGGWDLRHFKSLDFS